MLTGNILTESSAAKPTDERNKRLYRVCSMIQRFSRLLKYFPCGRARPLGKGCFPHGALRERVSGRFCLLPKLAEVLFGPHADCGRICPNVRMRVKL